MKRWEAKIPLQPTVCSICSENHPIEKCQILTEVKHIADNKPPTQARLSVPSTLGIRDTIGGVAIVAKAPLCRGTQFGPFKAQLIDTPPSSGFLLQIFHDNDVPGAFLETNNEHKCNWMCLVAAAENSSEQNLVAYQVDQKIYYSVTKNINVSDELKVWYAPFYATKLNKSLLPPGDSEEVLQNAIEDYNNTPTNLKRRAKLKHHSIPSSDPLVNDLTPKQLGAKVTKDQWPCKRCSVVEQTIPAYARHLMVHLQQDMRLALRLEKENQINEKGHVLLKVGTGEGTSNETTRPAATELPDPQLSTLPNTDLNLKNENSIEKLLSPNNFLVPQIDMLDPKSMSMSPMAFPSENKFSDTPTMAFSSDNKLSDTPTMAFSSENKLNDTPLMTFESENKFSHTPTMAFSGENKLSDTATMDFSGESKLCDTAPITFPSENKLSDEKVMDSSTLDTVNILDFEDLNISNLDKTVSLNNLFSLDNDLFINYNGEESRNGDVKKTEPAKLDFDFKSTSSLMDLNCPNLDDLINDIPLIKEPKRDDVDNFSDLFLDEKPVSSAGMFSDIKISGESNFSNYICEQDGMKVLNSVPASVANNLPMFRPDCVASCLPSLDLTVSLAKDAAAIAVPSKLMKTDSQETAPDPASDFTCEICMHEFKNARYLFRHLRLHLGEFTCTKCFRAFSRKQTLDDHLCKLFICTKCDQRFRFASHFQKHERWHTRTERLKAEESGENMKGLCKICNAKFPSNAKLRKHCKLVHTVDTLSDLSKKTCICSVCGNAYKDMNALKMHLQNHAEPQFECQICDKKFYRKSILRKHIVGVHGLTQFQCGQCGLSFSTEYAYQLHHKSIHLDPSAFKCKFCGKVLNRKLNLEKHEKKHLEQKLPCGKCNRTFRSLEGYEKHKKVHAQLKCFTCSQCSQVFVGSRKLKAHFKEAHFGPYTCSFCFMSIKKLSSLKKHLQCKHKDKRKEWSVAGYFNSLKGLTVDKNKNLNETSVIADDQMAFEASKRKAGEVPFNDLEPEGFDPVLINFDMDSSMGLGIFGADTGSAIISDVMNKKDEAIYESSPVASVDQFKALKRGCDVHVPMISGKKASVKEASQDFCKSDVLNIMIDGNQLYPNSVLDSSTLGLNSLGGEILWTVSDLPGFGCNQNIAQSLPLSDVGSGVGNEMGPNNGNMLLYVVEPSSTEMANNNPELVLF